MTPETLRKEQEYINDLIMQRAEECGIATNNIQPIFDGVAEEEGYLNSTLKVAWVLKEPWDDKDSSGRPCGGGWSLPKDCFYKDDAWSNPVWQKIAYVMHGFRKNLHWDEMRWIRDSHEMINEIRTVAWINVSKMPGYTVSNDDFIWQRYNKFWKDILFKQFSVFAPDVIIFGKTFHCFRGAYPDARKDDALSNDTVSYLRNGKQILLDTYHPGRKGGHYVDSLINALLVAKSEIKTEGLKPC